MAAILGHWATPVVLALSVATVLLALATWRVARRAMEIADGVRREAEAVVDQAEQLQSQTEAIREQTSAVSVLADAATSQVALTTAALRGSRRPCLTIAGTPGRKRAKAKHHRSPRDQPVWIEDDRSCILAGVRVRNVGNGLAVIRAHECVILGWRPDPDVVHGPLAFTSAEVEHPVLPPGESTKVTFSVRRTCARWDVDLDTFTNQTIGKVAGTNGHFYVDVVYGDVDDDEVVRARFHLAHGDGRWAAAGIDYYSPPSAETAQTSARFR